MKQPYILLVPALLFLGLASGCETMSHRQVTDARSAVELRSFQTRAFDTTDSLKTLRSVIATLQDLSFVIDEADATLGSVSATKLDGYEMRFTVTVRPRGQSQLLVRTNAQLGLKAIEDPQLYQAFFASLEKSMFLAAHAID
ncbi:MAG: hypothetical protein OEQ74_03840 [Gammaproteobacteria bacterium]|nr:hypothetical protein [Gammaproteobacteria bacterium]